jgi:hypothetical protein
MKRVLTEQQRVARITFESQRVLEAHNGRRVRLLLKVQGDEPVFIGFGQSVTEETGLQLRQEDGPLAWEVNPPQCAIYACVRDSGAAGIGLLCVIEAVDEG